MDHLHDPEFVKTAGAEKPRLFAYHSGIEGYFPIDTPENTQTSFEYFEKNAEYVPAPSREHVLSAINEAADFHGITLLKKEASAVEEDALAKLASEMVNFEDKHRSLPVRERLSHAKKLMEKVHEFGEHFPEGVKIPESVDRYAGEHFHPNWRSEVVKRLRFAPTTEARDAYHAVMHDRGAEAHPAHLIAELLEYLDSKHGLNSRWGRDIHDPYYGTLTCKKPEKVSVIVMRVKGKDYTDSDFSGLNREHFSGHLEDDVIDRIFNDGHANVHELPEFVKHMIAKAIDAR